MKKSEILSKNFKFLVVKFSMYLIRRVFVMGVRVIDVSLYKKSYFFAVILSLLFFFFFFFFFFLFFLFAKYTDGL